MPIEFDANRPRARLLLYEFAQEINRTASEQIEVAIGRGVDIGAATDLVDLLRLRLSRIGGGGNDPVGVVLDRAGLGDCFGGTPAAADLAVVSPVDLHDSVNSNLIRGASHIAVAMAAPIAATATKPAFAPLDLARYLQRFGFDRMAGPAEVFTRVSQA